MVMRGGSIANSGQQPNTNRIIFRHFTFWRKPYAVYRVRLERNSHCPDRFFDQDFDKTEEERNDSDGHYVSFAKSLGELTDTQLESLKERVGQKNYEICMSEDWNTDREKHGIIFLIKDAVYDHLGKTLDDAIKVQLKRMLERYNQALYDGQFDPSISKPLTHCFNIADDLRNRVRARKALKSSLRKKGVKADTIEKSLKTLLTRRSELVISNAKALAVHLGCSESAIKTTKMWRDIMKGRREAKNERIIKEKARQRPNSKNEEEYDPVDLMFDDDKDHTGGNDHTRDDDCDDDNYLVDEIGDS